MMGLFLTRPFLTLPFSAFGFDQLMLLKTPFGLVSKNKHLKVELNQVWQIIGNGFESNGLLSLLVFMAVADPPEIPQEVAFICSVLIDE